MDKHTDEPVYDLDNHQVSREKALERFTPAGVKIL